MKILDIPRSGSYAGMTSSRNRFGQYVRNRRSPVQPIGTGRRAFIRAAFGTASGAWAALTDEQKTAWDSFAGSHPVTNSLGASVTLTGHQMFVAVGTQRLNISAALGTAPPASTETDSLAGANVTADLTPSLAVTWPSGTTGDKVLVAASPQLSAGRRFPPSFWQQTVAIADFGAAYQFANEYAAQMGTLSLGNRIFIKLTPVNSEGWTGTPTIISTVVAPAPGP